jgi:hypothetical protein
MRARGAIVVVAALSLPAALYAGVYSWCHLIPQPIFPILDAASADIALRWLRAPLDETPGATGSPSLAALGAASQLPLRGPLWVSLYLRGQLVVRHRSDSATVGEALAAARHALQEAPAIAHLDAEDRQAARLRLDLMTARGPVVTGVPLALANSFASGRDGVGITVAGNVAYLLPDDLIRYDLLAAAQPVAFIAELRSGLDVEAADRALATELGATAAGVRAAHRYLFRFRVQSFVDSPDHARALSVDRGRVPVASVDRASVRTALERAADYAVRQLRWDGSFEYMYQPFRHEHRSDDYSLPRHAGTTWLLSLAYHVLGHARYREAATSAIDYLAMHAVPSDCQATAFACVGSNDDADLGSAALTSVAIVEYQLATGDKRFRGLAERLGRFLLHMQKPNGDFCHGFAPVTGIRDCAGQVLYYSGEAALALAKLHQILPDEALAVAVERALDYLTGPNYDYFLGQFFIGEDHWTCIAAEAAFPFVNKDAYARFCYAFARLNRRVQAEPDNGPLADLAGAFGVTPFFLPHNTPAGSRTEANVATYRLSVLRGEPQPDILETVRRSLRYLVDQQFRPESMYLFARPDEALGGIGQTPLQPTVRIDYIQHTASAMARGLDLVSK